MRFKSILTAFAAVLCFASGALAADVYAKTNPTDLDTAVANVGKTFSFPQGSYLAVGVGPQFTSATASGLVSTDFSNDGWVFRGRAGYDHLVDTKISLGLYGDLTIGRSDGRLGPLESTNNWSYGAGIKAGVLTDTHSMLYVTLGYAGSDPSLGGKGVHVDGARGGLGFETFVTKNLALFSEAGLTAQGSYDAQGVHVSGYQGDIWVGAAIHF